jgi:AAA domain, putative AbiEii toxin, Type IV TA system
MLLKSIAYSVNHDTPDYWEIRDLVFETLSLIVGRNATGKTRLMGVLSGAARMIKGTKFFTGKWELGFLDKNDEIYSFSFHIRGQQVLKEEIRIGERLMLSRDLSKGKLWNEKERELEDYEPPLDKLTLHVRRDKREYPYLEDIYSWANNYTAFKFAATSPNDVAGPLKENGDPLMSLAHAPQLLEKSMSDGMSKHNIMDDMESIGYSMENVSTGPMAGYPPNILALSAKETDLDCDTIQREMSAGMYRALATVIIINHLLQKKEPCTFAVDDIGEGLDFERSSRLIKLILAKTKDTNIQVILTSNDRHLLNVVDVRHWNILERSGSKVRAYNYQNSKKAFDEFMMTGLSNFDLFMDQMYKETSES